MRACAREVWICNRNLIYFFFFSYCSFFGFTFNCCDIFYSCCCFYINKTCLCVWRICLSRKFINKIHTNPILQQWFFFKCANLGLLELVDVFLCVWPCFLLLYSTVLRGFYGEFCGYFMLGNYANVVVFFFLFITQIYI